MNSGRGAAPGVSRIPRAVCPDQGGFPALSRCRCRQGRGEHDPAPELPPALPGLPGLPARFDFVFGEDRGAAAAGTGPERSGHSAGLRLRLRLHAGRSARPGLLSSLLPGSPRDFCSSGRAGSSRPGGDPLPHLLTKPGAAGRSAPHIWF